MSDLLTKAQAYCEYKQIHLILKPILGTGTDGTVWQTQEETAIKVFSREKNYFPELECYRRLKANEITQIMGFAVPELEGYADDLMVIEMSIVQAPYLLDFGKVYIDKPPPYTDDKVMMSRWYEECRELFGSDYEIVRSLLYRLQSFGIWYVDPKPANIRFRDEN